MPEVMESQFMYVLSRITMIDTSLDCMLTYLRKGMYVAGIAIAEGTFGTSSMTTTLYLTRSIS